MTYQTTQSPHLNLTSYIVNTLLPTVTTVRLANIFDNENTDLAGFPAATVTIGEDIAKVLDNTRNEIGIKLYIRVFIDRSRFSAQKAETILRNVATEIRTKLDSDITLGGNCIYTKPFNAKYGYVNREQNNIRIVEIELDCFEAYTWR